MNKPIKLIIKLIPVGIMLQTLFFKFTGAEESIYIFTKLGAEPFGRIGVGVMELIASLLILYPRTTFYGAALGLGLMLGALASHVMVLGINVNNDGGLLFTLAVITAVFCSILMVVYKNSAAIFLKNLTNKSNYRA